jgi:SAM-dependent methyltransferase
MQPDDVRELYDEATARTYNERWHGNPWGNDTLHLADAIGRRVHPEVRWLDVGCGTGHFLSRFPGIERAGTDLSPSMLAEAREASPDALFFEEWDFRQDRTDWHDGFSLVTCTGEPWSYVETIGEIEQLVANLAAWTAPGGTCLLAAQDPLDLTGMRLPYYIPGEPGFPGEIYLKAVVWSMVDRSHEHIPEIGPKWHHDLVWPLLEHWVAEFGRHFRTVIVETLPHDPPWLNTPRRVVVAKDKRRPGDSEPVRVVHTSEATAYAEMVPPEPTGPAEPPAPEQPPVAEPTPAPAVPPATPVEEVASTAHAPSPRPPAHPAPGRLRDKTVAELAGKLRPWEPRFWRSAGRRIRR